jgi:PAS domain S-box-containing protein
LNVLQCIRVEHDWRLLVIAAAVCAVSALTAAQLFTSAPKDPPWRRTVWFGLAGLVFGSGTWTTHFVAMLAYRMAMPTGYAEGPTLASLVLAVAGMTVGLAVGASPRRGAPSCGGALVGLTIAAMHYLGMSGFRTTGHLSWRLDGVVASVLLGVALGALAIMFAVRQDARFRRTGTAVLLIFAVVGLHFTGMAALIVTPDSSVLPPEALFSRHAMVDLAILTGGLIFIVAMAGIALDRFSHNAAHRRLLRALDAMAEGVALFDAEGRLGAWNAQYQELFDGGAIELAQGMMFEDLVRRGVEAGALPDAAEAAPAWLAARTAVFRGERSDIVIRSAGGRWMRISERPTASGGVVSTCVDITELKSAESALTLSRDRAERLAAVADEAEAMARTGHWRLDIVTGALEWSAGFARIYGLDQGEEITLDLVLAMAHPDDAPLAHSNFDRALAGESAGETQAIRMIRKDGAVRYLNSNMALQRDPDGRHVAVLGTIADVTEVKLAELAVAESEARFRNLASNAPDIIAESDEGGSLTYVSPVCEAITGYRPEELLGSGFGAMIHPDDVAAVVKMSGAVKVSRGATPSWPVEFRARHKSGAEIWLESRPTYVTDAATGEHVGFIDVIRDVTMRKRLEEDLRAAREAAEAAAAVKSEFLANMSHELRTPLTSIVGFVGMAAQQRELTPQTRHYVERVTEASKALLCTVNDILDFSKLEAGQVAIRPEPVRLFDLARSVLEMFAPQAGAKDLALELDMDDADLCVAFDPDRLRQILLNLVGNAVKFTDAGCVTLRTAYDPQRETLSVEVVDTGAGIPREKLERLFKRFSQVDGSRTRAQGGTGLGLAICKGLVEAMGGKIGVESQMGQGSRFWFSAPAPAAVFVASGADVAASGALGVAGLSVLVVDDHPANRELARLFLSGAGASVYEAEDGEAAVARAAQRGFDVILMDLRMPRLDGTGALKRLRSAPGPNRTTPVVAFTADLTSDLTASLRDEGFDGGVAKPLHASDLLETVAEAAHRSGPARNSAAA